MHRNSDLKEKPFMVYAIFAPNFEYMTMSLFNGCYEYYEDSDGEDLSNLPIEMTGAS